MIRLDLMASTHQARYTVGPAAFFRIVRGSLFAGAASEPIANYVNHGWKAQGEYHTRLYCIEPATIRFEDQSGTASEPFGPFEHFHTIDGCSWTGDEAFAHMDDRSFLWRHIPSGHIWSALLIGPPEFPLPRR